MAEKIEVEKGKEITFRDYWEILYKRRMAFAMSLLVIWGISAFFIFFVSDLKYKATATVIIGPPAVQIMTGPGWMIREKYRMSDEIELIGSSDLAERATDLLKRSGEYQFEISPSEISSMLRLGNRGRTNIIDISAISTDPQKAFFTVKSVIAAYIDECKERREKAIKGTYGLLSEQLLEKHKEIEDAEGALTKFVMEHDIIARGLEVGKDTEEGSGVAGWREPRINEKYLALKSERINKEAFLEEVKRHREEDEISTLSIIIKREETLVDLALRDELYEKERRLSKLLITQSELHPDVIEARGEVEEARKKVGTELDRAIQSLEISINTLKMEEEKLRVLIKEGLSETMVQYTALERDVAVKKGLYDKFVNQLHLLDVSEKLQNIPFLKITRPPSLPRTPINNRLKSIFLAFLAAVLGGVTFMLVLENIDISIGSAEEIENILGLTALGIIPAWKKEPGDEVMEKSREKYDIGLVTVRHPRSIMSEAFRTLRTNIKFVSVDKHIKSIVITSVGPKEGKSVIATNLAVAMARAGEKVVLVDGDLRRPTLHKYFNIDNSKGLSNLLIGEESIEKIEMHNTEVENLKIIPSGPLPPNPNELLGTERIEEILAKLTKKFDIVIVDSTPVLTVSDSLIWAAKTDGAILVFLANKTAKKAGMRTNFLVKNAGANVLGGILNGVKAGKGGSYYYNYEYYEDEDKKE